MTALSLPGESAGKLSGVMADISLLLDTDVLIEFFRGRPEAAEWLAGHGSSIVAIPVIVWMELLQGARNRMEQQRIEQQLAILPIAHIDTAHQRAPLHVQSWSLRSNSRHRRSPTVFASIRVTERCRLLAHFAQSP